jgi:hypothetical protein
VGEVVVRQIGGAIGGAILCRFFHRISADEFTSVGETEGEANLHPWIRIMDSEWIVDSEWVILHTRY